MKTRVIQLEPHDDLVSIRDKIVWAKAPRILLVWPENGKVDIQILDLKLIQRHANSLGAQLGLATRDRRIKRAAKGLGITLLRTAAESDQENWPERSFPANIIRSSSPRLDLRNLLAESRSSEPGWLSVPIVRVGFFSLALLSLLTLIFLFVPSAIISLNSVKDGQTVVVSVTTRADIDYFTISGFVPLQTASLVVEGKKRIVSSGELVLPYKRARGIVQFRNLTENGLIIPAGTVVSSEDVPPVQFVTTLELDIAAGTDQVVDVPVEAVTEGSGGNLDAGQIRVIEGALGLSLEVNNSEPISGGEDRLVSAPTVADRAYLRSLLQAELAQQALAVFTAMLDSQDVLLAETIQLDQLESEIYDPQDGQAGATLTLSMRAHFSISYVPDDDLLSLATNILNASLPAGYIPVPETTTIDQLDLPVLDSEGYLHWEMEATRLIQEQIEPVEVLGLVRGQEVTNAQQILDAAFLLAQPAEFHMNPAWWPWIPLLRIEIEIQ